MSVSASQEEELESLQAIYCMPHEFECWKTPEGRHMIIQFDFNPPHVENVLKARMRVILPHDYPLSCPKEMTVLCDNLSESSLHSVKLRLEEKAKTLKGECMILDLLCCVQELLETSLACDNNYYCCAKSLCSDVHNADSVDEGNLSSPSDTIESENVTCDLRAVSVSQDHNQSRKSSKLSTRKDSINLTSENNMKGQAVGMTALLQLDHMRSKQNYIKLIEKWTTELCLGGRLLFYGKFIFIILQGHSHNIKEYIIRNRTMLVDVDSKGQRCKERMLRVLCDVPSESFITFQEFESLDNISSFQDFTSLFQSFSMMDIFNGHIEPLCVVKSKKSSLKK